MSNSLSRNDRLIPWYFVAFFAFIVLVDSIMATLAVRTHTGTVSKHPYEDGLQYNRTIIAADAQAARNWKSTVTYTDGTLLFTLQDANGMAAKATHVRAEFRRPTDSNHDFTVTLTEAGKAIYKAPVAFPLKGQWNVRIYADTNQGSFQQSKRLLVP